MAKMFTLHVNKSSFMDLYGTPANEMLMSLCKMEVLQLFNSYKFWWAIHHMLFLVFSLKKPVVLEKSKKPYGKNLMSFFVCKKRICR